MNLLLTLAALVLSADEPKWKLAAREDGVMVYSKQAEGQEIAEMKATGIIEAPPHDVYKAIRDYDNYDKTMPYTEQSKVIAKADEGKTVWFYSVVNAPLVDRRDYVIKVIDESDWKEGKGFLKVSWKAWNEKDKNVEEKKDITRVKLNDGYWLLEPREDGKKTFATYYLYTAPGGSIPNFVVNKANSTAVPNVFKAIKKVVQK